MDLVFAIVALLLAVVELARTRLESLLAWAVLCLALIVVARPLFRL